MNRFTIESNEFLRHNIQAFYNTDYVGFRNPGNPDYINDLKNTFNDFSTAKLNSAVQELKSTLLIDLPQIQQIVHLNPLTVCVVPRAKREASYQHNQLLFKLAIKDVVNSIQSFLDGTDYIKRIQETKTTHLRRPIQNYNNDGPEPYPGITSATCSLSNNVSGENILLT